MQQDTGPSTPRHAFPWRVTLTLDIRIVHHVLLQTVEDFLNLTPGHTAAVHSLGEAAACFLWPGPTQKQLQVLAYVRERSSPIKEITKYILGTPWAGRGTGSRVAVDGEAVTLRELREGTGHLGSSQARASRRVFHLAIRALDVPGAAGLP